MQKILGVDSVAQVCDETNVGLVGAGQVQDRETGLSLDVGKELVEPVTVPWQELGLREGPLQSRVISMALLGG
jgi:hypothetical protein